MENLNRILISALNELNFEVCLNCGKRNTSYNWCQGCNSSHFKMRFCKWSSGNPDVDKFIRDTQINPLSRNRILEWIPYDELKEFRSIGKGGFGNVQEASWNEGQIDLMIGWNYLQRRWERNGRMRVAVKILDNSRIISGDFFKEMMPYLRTRPSIPNNVLNRLVKVFGISKNPSTQKYLIVMQFANEGKLRSYLERNYSTMTWIKKLFILRHISESLKNIHETGLICKNLHTGNILLHEGIPLIGDLGLCRPVNRFEKRGEIYGVLPYVAPEVLRNKKYTKESDIYSFAFIMLEMCTHHPPFYDQTHDTCLALNICLGTRPEIPKGSPEVLINLIRRCWNANPSKRPTAEEVFISLSDCYTDTSQMYLFESNAANQKESNNRDVLRPPFIKYHPEVHYHSRPLNFSQLPQAINVNDPIDDQSASLENYIRDSFP